MLYRCFLMSKILDLYKRYKELLVKQDVALDKLDEIEKKNQQFIEIEKTIFEDNITAQLKLTGLSSKLEGTQKDLDAIESKLKKPDLTAPDREKLVAESQEKSKTILMVKEDIVRYEIQKRETAERLPWKSGQDLLTTRHLLERRADLGKFCPYMDSYKHSISIRSELIDIQGSLALELTKASKQEKEEALAWSKENVHPIQRKVFEKENQPKNSGSFLSNLQEAYRDTCMTHARSLDKPDLIDKVQQGKIGLG